MAAVAIRQEVHAPAPQPVVRPHRLERAGLALGGLALVAFALSIFAFSHDDAFITYRYSQNLRSGLGAVFNPGDPVEGYSCPLYMLLSSLLMFLPGDPLIRAKLLGVLFALGALRAVWLISRELRLPLWVRAAVPVMVGANGGVALAAVDGMETTLQMWLVTSAALALLRECRTGLTWRSAAWLLAAALNRAEGVIFFVCALAPVFCCWGDRGRKLRWLAVFVGPAALFVMWRLWYYGDLLPNTVYAKNMGLSSLLDPTLGPAYLLRTVFVNLNDRVVVAVVSGLFWVLAIGGALSERLKRPGGFVLPLFVMAQALVTLKAGGDWMHGWRYMMAVVPIWTLLVVIALSDIMLALGGAGRRGLAKAAAISGTALFLGPCVWAWPEYRDPTAGGFSWARQGWTTDARHLLKGYRMENAILTADFLNRTVPGGSAIAFSEMGAVPYYTPGLRWLDTHGLVDRQVARLDAPRFRTGIEGDYTTSGSAIGKHLIDRKPEYVLQWLRSPQSPGPILGGRYVPTVQTRLGKSETGAQLYLHLWRRAF